MTWRDVARPIIAECLEETKGMDEKEIRRALREVYPFGERKYYPYKVWLDEIKRQRGFKPPLYTRRYVSRDPNQLSIEFNGS